MGDFDVNGLGLGAGLGVGAGGLAALGSSSMFDMSDIQSSMPGIGNPLGDMDTTVNPVDAGLSSGDFFDSSMNDMGNSIQAAASGLFDAPSESFLDTDETGDDDYMPGQGYNNPREINLDAKGSDYVYTPDAFTLLNDARDTYRRIRPYGKAVHTRAPRELDLDDYGTEYVYTPTPRELLDDTGSLYRHIRGRGYNGHTTITLPEQTGPKSIGKAWRLAREPGLGRKKFTTLYDGTEVDMVNGAYIRDTTTEDYLLGSNPRADPALVPPGHIYISDINVRAPNGLHDAYGIITHEGSEVGGMKYGGLSYKLAHEHYGEVGEELFRNTVPANASERTMWLASNRIIKMETERAATHSYGMDFIGLANTGKRANSAMEFGGLANVGVGSGLSLDLGMGSYKLPAGDYGSGFSALKLDFGGLGGTGRKQKGYDYGDTGAGIGFDLNSLGFDRVSARTAKHAVGDTLRDGIGFAIGAIGTGMALGIGMNVMKGFTNNNFFGGGRLW
jgi:hypothetical protein